MRGRAWIVVVAGLLIGLVALQVTLLGLNSSIGRSVEKQQTLERRNAVLREQVVALGAPARIAKIAKRGGFVMPAADQVGYVRAHGGDARRAAATMIAPTGAPLAAAPAEQAPAEDPAAAPPGEAQAIDPVTGRPLAEQPAEEPAAGTDPALQEDPAAADPYAADPSAGDPAAGTYAGDPLQGE